MTEENDLIQAQEEAIAIEIAHDASIYGEDADIDADMDADVDIDADADEQAASVYGQKSDVDWWGAKTASEYNEDVAEDGGALRSPDVSVDDCDCCNDDLADLDLE